MFKYIFFDFDGTLVNSSEGVWNALYYMFDKLKIKYPPKEMMPKFIGPPLTLSFSEYLGMSVEEAEKAIEVYREYYNTKGCFETEIYGGIENLLKKIKNSGRFNVVTSTKPEIMCEKILKEYNIDSLFAAICGSVSDFDTKAIVIKRAIKKLRADNLNEVLMVGDRKYDVEGAKEAGIRCAGVKWGFAEKDEFEKAGADFIVSDVKELEEIIFSN